MLQTKKYLGVALALALILGVNSCALFRGKNKCGDCPTWSKVETPANSASLRV